MSVHMLVGDTVGSEKIIKSLRRRGQNNIFISDEYYEGPPAKYGGVIYLTPKDAMQLWKRYPNITFHFYKNNLGLANIDGYEFRD